MILEVPSTLDDSMVCKLIIACAYQGTAVSQECGGVRAQEQQQINTAPAIRLDYKQGAKSLIDLDRPGWVSGEVQR